MALRVVSPRTHPAGYDAGEVGSRHRMVGPEMGHMRAGQDLPVTATQTPWPQRRDDGGFTFQQFPATEKSQELMGKERARRQASAPAPSQARAPRDYNDAAGSGRNVRRTPQSRTQIAAQEWRDQGMSDAGTAGAMANIQSESGWRGGLRERNPTGNAKRLGGGVGIYQFTGLGEHQLGRYYKWMDKNYPKESKEDNTKLETRFVAEQIKRGDTVAARGGGAGVPGSTWERMRRGTPEQAAQAFVKDYERPAAKHLRSRSAQYGKGVTHLGTMHGTAGEEMGHLAIGQDVASKYTEARTGGIKNARRRKNQTKRINKATGGEFDNPTNFKVEPIDMTQIGLWYSWMGSKSEGPSDPMAGTGAAGVSGGTGGGGGAGGGGLGSGSSRGGGGRGGRGRGGKRRGGGGGGGGGDGTDGGGGGATEEPKHARARTPFRDSHPGLRHTGNRAHTPFHASHPGFHPGNHPNEGGGTSHKADTPWHNKQHPKSYFNTKSGGGTGDGGGKKGKAGDKQKVADEWRRQGMSDAGAAGAMANIGDESAWKNDAKEQNPTGNAKRQGGGHGLYQFTGDQWNRYQKWMGKTNPKGDWRDATLQTRFVAEQIKRGDSVASKGGGAGRPGSTWEKMRTGTKEQAAQAFIHGYERPRADHLARRSGQYGRGVPGLDKYGVGKSGPGGRSQIDTSIPDRTGGAGGGARGGSGGGTVGPGGGGVVSELQGKGTRNQAITPALRAQLAGAGKATGLNTEVFSGGQPSSGPHRTGSHRHDHGQSADVYLRDQSGHKLSMNNAEDRAKMGNYISEAVKRGATGVGAAPDYMGEHGIHVGGGNPGTWGAGGHGPGPKWVQDAWRRGRDAPSVREAPIDTVTTRKPTMQDRRFTAPRGDNPAPWPKEPQKPGYTEPTGSFQKNYHRHPSGRFYPKARPDTSGPPPGPPGPSWSEFTGTQTKYHSDPIEGRARSSGFWSKPSERSNRFLTNSMDEALIKKGK